MHHDFKELLSAFNAAGVRYLIVGGYAVSLHAQPRATKDLDILIATDAENGEAAYTALAKFGAPVEGLSAKDFTEPDNFFRMGTPPVMVDIMPRINGVDFEVAWQRRVNVAIEDDLIVPFISHEDLLAAKISAGRPQDLADAAALNESSVSRTGAFEPHLEVLPPAQRKLWSELREVPREFVLYGGTALALHLGHRHSIDFDFFANRVLDISKVEQEIPFLKGANVTQREKNTLSAIVDRDGPVKVSFFGVPNLPRLAPPLISKGNGLAVASLLDLAGTKASVVQMRAEAKDYIDIDALMTKGRVDLSLALSAAQGIYGPTFNAQITLKALSYFDDGDLRQLPDDMKLRLARAARNVDLDHLPRLDSATRQVNRDHGLEL